METWSRLLLGSGVALIGSVGVAVMTLGPDEAWQRLKYLGGLPTPHCRQHGTRPGRAGRYLYRHPAESVVEGSMTITGYAASSLVGLASAQPQGGDDDGGVTIMQTKEPAPDDCTGLRKVALARPLKIEPDGIRAVRVRPWQTACWFEVRFYSDHGETALSSEFGAFDLSLKEQLNRYKGGAIQKCPDGTLVPVKETCPPPPPPPPPLPTQ